MTENIKTLAEKGERKCMCVKEREREREREREGKKDSNANPTLGSVLQSALLRESSFVPQIGALHTALL